ncbi:MAG: glycoside hydrolase family 28 protein, partial [Alistipes sp.]|nr:glycoside hydrolase family 28 protein [Alistipes sp.]
VEVEHARIYAATGAQIESTDVVLRDVTVVPEKGAALILNNVKNFRAEDFACPVDMKCALVVTGSRNRDIRISSKEISAANARLSAGAAPAVTFE